MKACIQLEVCHHYKHSLLIVKFDYLHLEV